MAIAKVEITCKVCGCSFTYRKECYNRRQADEHEVWAISNVDTCPECRKKAMAKQQSSGLEAILSRYSIQLPVISGVSDKQINYADSVRGRYLSSDLAKVEKYCKIMQALNDPAQAAAFAGMCDENGITVDEGIKQNMQAMQLGKVMLMMTATEARTILDAK